MAGALVGLLNALAHRLVAHRLDADAYGALATLLAGLTAVGVVLGGVQIALARAVSLRGTTPGRALVLRRWGPPTLLIGGVLAAAVAAGGALSSPVGSRATLGVLLGGCALLAVLAVVPLAVLLGEGRLGRLSAVLVAGSTAKLLVALTSLSEGLFGSVAALAVGEAVTLVVAVAALPTGDDDGEPLRVSLGALGLAVAGVGGLWLVGGLDAAAARVLLDPLAADAYAAASALARAGFFVPAAIAVVTFSRMLGARPRSVEQRRTLRVGLVATGALAVAAAGAVLVSPGALARALTGDNVIDLTALRLLAVAWALLAPAHLLVLFLVASSSRLALLPWAALPVAALGAVVAPHTPSGLALVVFLAAVVVLAALAAPALLRTRPVTRAVPVGPPTPIGPPRQSRCDVAIVVPYFNPGQTVATTLRRLDAVLAGTGRRYEIIAVADGCTDGSPELVDRMGLPTVRTLRLPVNRGKGAAVRAGLAASGASLAGYLDADGDIDPALVPRLIAAIEASGADVALGSKRHPDSVVHIATVRRFWSWGYQRLVRLLFRLDVGDTQTGIKLMRGEVVDDLLGSMVEDRFAFDLELFVLARARGHTAWVEVPVTLGHKERSTVSWRAVVRTLGDTLRIFGRLTIALGYDLTADPRLVTGSPALGDLEPAAGRSASTLRSGATR